MHTCVYIGVGCCFPPPRKVEGLPPLSGEGRSQGMGPREGPDHDQRDEPNGGKRDLRAN